MTQYAVPLIIAVASIALTWFFCTRPMRRGNCAMTSHCATPQADVEAQAEIQALSREIAELRASMGLQPRD